MQRWIARWLASVGVVLALGSPTARAADKAAAEVLFREGKELMAAGRLDEACAKLAASVKAEMAIGSLLNLALCHEKQGKTASAWAEYHQAADVARKHGDVRRERAATELAGNLQPTISQLIVEVDHAVAGLEIRRDGELLVEAVWGESLPVDPGEHAITASAPGYESWTFTVVVAPHGDVQSLAVPPLTLSPMGPPVTTDGVSPLTVGGGVALGVGLAGVVVSAVLGGIAADDVASAEERPDLCPERVCSAAGRDQIDQAKVYADVSTAAFVVGGAALVAGIVMLVWPDAEPDPALVSESSAVRPTLVPLLGPKVAGAGVGGRF